MNNQKISNIAAEAKVSTTTVWRVLNDPDSVSARTRQRIEGVLLKLGYRKPLKNVIALIVPDSSNPFFAQLGFDLEGAAEKIDWQLFICSSEGNPDRESQLVEWFQRVGFRGLIYVPLGQDSKAPCSRISDGSFPVLIFDREETLGNFDFVAVDSQLGTHQAVDYLVTQGHRRIAYIKGLDKTRTAKERFASFLEAMKRHNLVICEEHIFSGDYTLISGSSCADILLRLPKKKRPTALLAANDLMAIGVMQRLQTAGWSLPKDLSVIGFDDIQWASWVCPSLTTIAQPIDELAATAVRLLTDRIMKQESGGATPLPHREVLQPKLVVRASVAKFPR